MIYSLLSLFNKTCHFSGVKALWCSGRRVRLCVESIGFNFFSSGYDCFSLFLSFFFVLFYNNISRLEKGKPNFTTICNFGFFFLWLNDIYLIKWHIPYYLYLIKLANFLASKLCGVVVGEWDYMLKVPGSIFFFGLWFFVFFVFILLFCSFFTTASAVWKRESQT